MISVTVQTNIPSTKSQSHFIWFVMEIDAPSIEAIHRRLVDEGSIYGQRVVTDLLPDGTRKVVRRSPHIVSENIIQTIAPAHFEYEG